MVGHNIIVLRRSNSAHLAPERLSDEERALWEKLTFSRRPGWFSGAESLLESYVTTVSQVQQLEAALRKAKPGTGERYQKLAREWLKAVYERKNFSASRRTT